MGEKEGQESGLKPSLGLFDATAISIGAIIGGGIFVVTGIAAGYAGSALVISMLTAAGISLLTALSLTELTAWLPREGGVYEYTYRLISPFAGFLTGWMWMLSNTFAGAAVSLAFGYYTNALLPVLPASYVAAAICVAFTLLNYYGVRQSALLNNSLVVAKLVILSFFIILGVWFVKPDNFLPFKPFDAGVLYGAVYVFFAYGGFARVSIVAEEVKDSRRNVPRAIMLSLLISTLVYILVGVVAVGLAGASVLRDSKSPLTEAIGKTGYNVATWTVSLGGLLATASVLLTSILGVSRVAYAMARRNDLPHVLSKLHEKHNTPYFSILITGALMVLLVLFVDLNQVVVISTFAMLFYYALVNVSAFRMKDQEKTIPAPMPILGAGTCLALLIFILFVSPEAWIAGLAGLLAGAVFYLARQRITVRRRQIMN